jgi:hypothetical protein
MFGRRKPFIEMRIIMSTNPDQDTLDTFVTVLTTLTATLNAAIAPGPGPVPLDFTGANTLLAAVQADVDALTPAQPPAAPVPAGEPVPAPASAQLPKMAGGHLA